jgi:hypothetical protein
MAVEDSLLANGHEVLRLPSCKTLPVPVAAHADLLLYFVPDAILCTKDYFEIAENELKTISQAVQKPLRFIDGMLGDVYPKDVPLNAVSVGDVLFCNPKTVANRIRISLTDEKTVFVKQGYTKCSILPVGENALITEDDAIAALALENGFDVLRIEKGSVSLPGYDTGFLGGAASFAPYEKIKEIFFCGDLCRHPDFEKIQAFCKKHDREAISLGKFPLLDVGTIFLI